MFRKFLFSILVLAVGLFFAGQNVWAAGWVLMDTPTSLTLNSNDQSQGNFYMAGKDGGIFISPDGKTWDQAGIVTTLDFYGIDAYGGTCVNAVGENGLIYHSSDNGEVWEKVIPNAHTEYDLYGVKMASTSIGYAVGESGLVLKTTDGGDSWKEVDHASSHDLFGVSTVSTTEVWVVGAAGNIYHTTDSGETWESQPNDDNHDLLAVDFVNSEHGFAVGEGTTFLVTDDGGEVWEDVDIDFLSDGVTIKDVDFYDENNGLLEGLDGTHLVTADGGVTWEEYSLPSSTPLLSLSYPSENAGFGVGSAGRVFRYDGNSPSNPGDFTVDSGSPTSDATPLFTWEDSTDDESDVDHYEFKMDDGDYEDIGDHSSYVYSETLSDGSHKAYLYAVDEANNYSEVVSETFTVNSEDNDSLGPTVSKISPTTGAEDYYLSLNAEVSDSATACSLYIDGDYKQAMTVRDGWASVSYRFTDDGRYSVYARCADADSYAVNGSAVTVSIGHKSSNAEPGDLIKTTCGDTVYVNDPCTAVYYYGTDSKRHAFPNEAVYKSWYDDFDSLVLLSDSAMAEISLGQNVTYHPASHLVKFSTNTVYAISYGGVLRPIDSEEMAAAVFGSSWATQVVDINDVFFGNYEIGTTIESSRDFYEEAVADSVDSIDNLF